MTKFQYYYEKSGQKINTGKKSRNDFKYVVIYDQWNCGSYSYHTTYEKALKRLNWNLFHYPNNLGKTRIEELKIEEL